MFKLKFSTPTFTIEGKTTIISISVALHYNHCFIKIFKIKKKISLKEGDRYDLNKAYKYLQASAEKEAYEKASKVIKNIIEQETYFINKLNTFKNKAEFIVNHDKEYLKEF